MIWTNLLNLIFLKRNYKMSLWVHLSVLLLVFHQVMWKGKYDEVNWLTKETNFMI
jgi:hypothetical protein